MSFTKYDRSIQFVVGVKAADILCYPSRESGKRPFFFFKDLSADKSKRKLKVIDFQMTSLQLLSVFEEVLPKELQVFCSPSKFSEKPCSPAEVCCDWLIGQSIVNLPIDGEIPLLGNPFSLSYSTLRQSQELIKSFEIKYSFYFT